MKHLRHAPWYVQYKLFSWKRTKHQKLKWEALFGLILLMDYYLWKIFWCKVFVKWCQYDSLCDMLILNGAWGLVFVECFAKFAMVGHGFGWILGIDIQDVILPKHHSIHKYSTIPPTWFKQPQSLHYSANTVTSCGGNPGGPWTCPFLLRYINILCALIKSDASLRL